MSSNAVDLMSAELAIVSGPWRALSSPPASGATNMAIDHALMAHARRTGERTLRVYSWSRPTLSLGRHQAVRGRMSPATLAEIGVSLVRRPTGGRALLHHREVTYSVTAPLRSGDSARGWYAAITGVLLTALRSLGVAASPAVVTGRTPPPGAAACFARPDAGEIAFEGRKLAGSALLRENGVLLQHGSILLENDQILLSKILPGEAVAPAGVGTLRDAMGHVPTMERVAAALFGALGQHGGTITDLTPDRALLDDVTRAEARYASDEWTWRA